MLECYIRDIFLTMGVDELILVRYGSSWEKIGIWIFAVIKIFEIENLGVVVDGKLWYNFDFYFYFCKEITCQDLIAQVICALVYKRYIYIYIIF